MLDAPGTSTSEVDTAAAIRRGSNFSEAPLGASGTKKVRHECVMASAGHLPLLKQQPRKLPEPALTSMEVNNHAMSQPD